MNIAAVTSTTPVTGITPSAPAGGVEETGFADKVSDALESLNDTHLKSDDLATQAATGDLESLTSYVVAATEAQLATQVTVAVRNKAVEAFNQVMGMNV